MVSKMCNKFKGRSPKEAWILKACVNRSKTRVRSSLSLAWMSKNYNYMKVAINGHCPRPWAP